MSNIREDFTKFCITCLEHKPFTIEEINIKRNSIELEIEKMTKTSVNVDNFNTVLTQPVLNKIVEMYDSKFFYGKLVENLKKNGCVLRVCFDNRCTKTAGVCIFDRCKSITVKLSTKVFQKALKTGDVKINSGLKCSKFLTCLLITFEHELMHGLVFCLCSIYEDSALLKRENPSLKLFENSYHDKSGHGKLFMTIVNNKFGHTKYRHDLFSHKPYSDENSYKLLSERMTIPEIRKTLSLGDKITILANGVIKEGEIFKILIKYIYWKDKDARWKSPISRIIDTSKKVPSPEVSAKPKTPSPPKTKKKPVTLLTNLNVGDEVILNARLPGKEDLYTLLVKINNIDRRKKTKQINVTVLDDGEFKGKRLFINPGMIVTSPDNPLVPASPKIGRRIAYNYDAFDSITLTRKPRNFTNDIYSVDVNKITPKLIEKINSLPRYNWPADKTPTDFFPEGKKIGGGKDLRFIVMIPDGTLVLGQGEYYMRYGIKLEGVNARRIMKANDFEYKEIWTEEPRSSPPKEKKTKLIDWDGPHNDMYIPGAVKECRGKKITTLEEAKRISIKLGDKSTGFTKKKFYSMRTGKTLKKGVGEISWLKKNHLD